METRLRGWSIGLLEALLLLAVGAVPIFVNYYGFRVFELGKASLLLAIAAFIAVALVIALGEGGLGAIAGLGSALRQPLGAAAALLALGTVLATVTARVGGLAFFGSPERQQGMLQVIAVLMLFAAAAFVARTRRRRQRIVATMLAASVPVALYALTQAMGLEAVLGRSEDGRVFGTLSNPIFLGAYLMLLAPLAMERIAAAARAERFVVGAGWTVVLALQLLALVLTASRGPLLGLTVGILVMALAVAAVLGKRTAGFAVVGVMILTLAILAVLNAPDGPGAALRDVPVVGRFTTIGAFDEGSQAVRLRVWDAVARLVAEEPARLLTGHGPESLRHALLPYGDTYLAGRSQAARIVDRSHSVPFDALTMTGLLGLLAQLAVWGAATYTAVVLSGLAPRRGQRMFLAALLTLTPAIGGAAGWMMRPGFVGALLALGLVGGLALYLMVSLVRGGSLGEPAPGALALLAVAAAATTEGAFGIRTVVTEVTWWILAGLLLALALSFRDEEVAKRATPTTRRRQRTTAAATADAEDGAVVLSPRFSAGGAGTGIVFGLLAIIPVYSLWPPSGPPTTATMPIMWLMVVGLIVGGMLATADSGEGISGALLPALMIPALFTIVRAVVLLGPGGTPALFTTVVLVLLIGALAAGLFLRAPVDDAAPTVDGPQVIAYPLLSVGAVVAVMLLALAPVRGDIRFQQAVVSMQVAMNSDDPAAFQLAEALFEEATRFQPRDDGYHLRWAEMYTSLSDSIGDLQAAQPFYSRADDLLAQAQAIDPLLATHTFNRGHLVLMMAERIAGSGMDPTAAAAGAQTHLEQAFAVLHYEPQVANELALSRMLQGQVDRAIVELEYSRDFLDEANPQTHQLLSRAYQLAGRVEDSESALTRAMQLGGVGEPSVLLQRADRARQEGDLEAARSLYEQAVQQLGANADWRVLYNLALLYRDTGSPQRATDTLTAAMQLTGGDQQALETVETALRSLLADDEPPGGFLEAPQTP